MKNLIFVDVEADGGACPAVGRMTEFGAVDYTTRDTFHGIIVYDDPLTITRHEHRTGPDWTVDAIPAIVFTWFDVWLIHHTKKRAIFVSDNPAFDWQWINDGFHTTIGRNRFGHSARRISDFYAGLVGNFMKTQDWKGLRITPHDHNPVHDAMGNVEAFARLLNGERP